MCCLKYLINHKKKRITKVLSRNLLCLQKLTNYFLCVCVVHVHVDVCTCCMPVTHAYGGQRSTLNVFFNPLLLFLRQWTWRSLIWIGWPVSEFRDLPVSVPPSTPELRLQTFFILAAPPHLQLQ